MSLKNWSLLCLLALIWGGTFPLAKLAVAEIPPLVLVFARVAIAAVVLHIILRLRGLRFPLAPDMLLAFLAMGLLNNAIPFSLIFWGQTEVSASLASILNATTPIFTVIVASVVFSQEVLKANRVAGIALGFAGVAVLLSPGLFGIGTEPLWAKMLFLGAALSYAFAATFARRFSGVSILVAAAGQLTGSTLLMAPLAFWQASAWQGAGWSLAETSVQGWVAMALLGVLCTAFAYLIYFRLLREAGATNASLVTLLVPVTATAIGVAFLGEALSGLQFAGMAILLAGLCVLDGRVFKLFALRDRPASKSGGEGF
ncbi:DMT family transporter [Stappia stellulata]|uniref:DMT family transporter n=1 Tax=Stappia stellulata TaxID=71235 RepID=UPI00042328C6|nr:DMT family transporter [Stappia stellulata]